MDNDNIEHSYLYKKIDSIEHRLESHVAKIEQRLDQLVTIMGSVATLQERETRNAGAIREIRLSIKESIDKFDKAIDRIHGRLDEVSKSVDAGMEIYSDNNKEIEKEIRRVDGEVSKWRERGLGLWVGISALIIALEVLGGIILTNVQEEYKVTKAQVINLAENQRKMEQELVKANAKLITLVPHP